ncbi:MAG: diacylglycerol kinase family protein [Clostridia bacterium]|nr:diacylglycerol kinase family protein [Clostridia bacterium]
MAKYRVLYNPKSNNGQGETEARTVETKLNGEFYYQNALEIPSHKEFINSIASDETVVLVGGDGTINYFANALYGTEIKPEILYYPIGTGNDFMRDITGAPTGDPIRINEYITDLPLVSVNGVTKRFINGVGYGIDGYCCEVGDKLREKSVKKINYTGIAIKGLLFHYRPSNATVIVDGKEYNFKKVWIAPTMKGRYYGGGMIPTPSQDRNNPDKTVSVMVMYGKGRLSTLIAFPTIFKGEHIKKTNMVSVLTGKNITVRYDRPQSLQIDGETVLGVSEYSVTVD